MTDFHTVKPIDNSRLVRPTAPCRLREMGRLLGLGVLVAAVALLYAWQHFSYIQLRYQLESLKAQRTQSVELNRELKLEVAGLRAPSRIDQIAKRQLGLTAPVAGQVELFDAASDAAVLAEMRGTSSNRAQ
jgi:cell division protein FtsL